MEKKLIRQVLESFEIIVDTREQPTKRAKKRLESFGVSWSRAALSYGDYTYNVTLPAGEKLHDISSTVYPLCAVERKMNLDELAGCFTQSRQRFQREFERAAENDCQMYLVCENASWENLINGRYHSRMNTNAFVASCITWMVRYNMGIVFCKEETSSRIIKEILYRDLKEKLEKGIFDGFP